MRARPFIRSNQRPRFRLFEKRLVSLGVRSETETENPKQMSVSNKVNLYTHWLNIVTTKEVFFLIMALYVIFKGDL